MLTRRKREIFDDIQYMLFNRYKFKVKQKHLSKVVNAIYFNEISDDPYNELIRKGFLVYGFNHETNKIVWIFGEEPYK